MKKILFVLVSIVTVVILVNTNFTSGEFSDVKYGRFVFNESLPCGTIIKHDGNFIELKDGRIFKSGIFKDLKDIIGKEIWFSDRPYGIGGFMYKGHKVEASRKEGTFFTITTAKKKYMYLLGPTFCGIENKLYKMPYTSRACYRE